MAARVIVVILILLFSACATTQSPISLLPKVLLEGNKLVEPEYGYSVQIPNGWKLIDESYLARLSPDRQKRIIGILNRLVLDRSFRACFVEPTGEVGVTISALAPGEITSETKEDFLAAWRENTEELLAEENNRYGFERFYNLEFNRFKKLTDINASYETSDKSRTLFYVRIYSFKQSSCAVMLAFNASLKAFDSFLPLFYDCVNSISVSGINSTPQKQESLKAISERLEELKRLKEKSLITDEDYQKKKKQILDEL